MTLPELHLADWRPTKDTLHLYCQIVGKVRLATTPPRNQWWNVPLYVDVRGLSTRRLHHNDTTFQIDFDFVDHVLWVRTSDGDSQRLALAPMPVAQFYAEVLAALDELEVAVRINPMPNEIADAIPFDRDRVHAAYDREYAGRFWRVLLSAHRVLALFRTRFVGKVSPVKSGLTLFLGIVYVVLRDLVRARRRWLTTRPDVANLATGFALAIVAYLATGLFLHLAFERYFWLLIGLAAATAWIALQPQDADGTAALREPA